jgi:hypothetical protein
MFWWFVLFLSECISDFKLCRVENLLTVLCQTEFNCFETYKYSAQFVDVISCVKILKCMGLIESK